MVNILVRNVDDAVAARLKKKAKAGGKSVNELARDTLRAAAKPSKDEAWAAVDRIPQKSAPGSATIFLNSTAGIREDRDNDEPYR